jgi:hypothetical protein
MGTISFLTSLSILLRTQKMGRSDCQSHYSVPENPEYKNE